MGVRRAIIMGHSWGCLVAVALADRHPDLVRGLVLASGRFFPMARVDVVAMATPAVPMVGDIVRYAVAPPLSRLIWPLLLKKIFGPQKVPGKFAAFPRGMAIRPSQIRASAAESGLMIPGALAARNTYARLKMPVAIIAGSDDRIVDIDQQSARLHTQIRQSSFERLPGAGHMIHQTETNSVVSAIARVSHAANIVERGFAESRAARERG
ncbi:alpha/beta hydrolase [Paracoccus jeotgali]|uniref:alpha/beta hydrolase n=1 Tax=Paracoccus jeotgali TaxID=2065379 RepID=UPI0021F2967B|nr:alpha/beta hydrolase [Paracoccus jeotgali]